MEKSIHRELGIERDTPDLSRTRLFERIQFCVILKGDLPSLEANGYSERSRIEARSHCGNR